MMEDHKKTSKPHIADLVGLRQQTSTPEASKNEPNGANAELKAAHLRLQHVLAVCPAIIYSTQASGDFACTFISENIKQVLGYTQREMRDDPDFWTGHIHPQDTRHVLSEVHRLVSEGGGNLEYRFRHHDGHYRWFQDTFKTVYDEAGKPLEIVGSWADITQRKLAEFFQMLYQGTFKISMSRWGLKSGSTASSQRRGMSSIWTGSASFSPIQRVSGFRRWQALRLKKL